ncbi:cytochrome d ubiquinol oxidase subunit 2 [Paenibacillus yonginensis]|uniref:Cytochrome d ubiquinol oxidase subunit 2 n=1 Tax=Paenibacillus yonginensis TaxID=1462996 RepID=A0A1B1N5F9_9BACL|nr:cytochrome d ubiquinol oxidase subunit II [Paenibacillus yonginensis]ANS76681.1 cytochrome d ubiquinol oxidase subunit 2 [Paenibacillus yonginensis]
MLSLNELWFILVAVLFIGFFFLEGFDFGVGMATGILAKNDTERRVLINAIGPFWDGNEVWLLTAGGAIFAAFPNWYATMFSGYYTPLVVLLLALIARGVAFEFRGKVQDDRWKKTWDVCIFIGSLLPPFLLGVVFAGFMKGLPIDGQMEMRAGLFDMVNWYTLVGGITVTVLCFVHGLLFTVLRTEGELQNKARKLAKQMLYPLAALLALTGIATYFATDIFEAHGAVLSVLALLGLAAFLLAGYFLSRERDGWAFGMTGAVIALAIVGVFAGLFPNVMISSIDTAFNLTIHNAASGHYSLKVMTIVAVSLLPFVLGYQIWSYFVFHKRVHEKSHLEY